MKFFNNPGQFAEHLLGASIAIAEGAKKGLEACAIVIKEKAKNEIGHLQRGAGPFPDWRPLAESTTTEKERLGYGNASNDWQPLLRTGELRDSIQYEVSSFEAIIGSKSPIMAYQELGTRSIPPRSVLGLAAYKSHKAIFEILGKALIQGFYYGKPIDFIKGYELTEINYE